MELHGWGRYPRTRAPLWTPATAAAAVALAGANNEALLPHEARSAQPSTGGLTPRGCGRAYGDAALPPPSGQALSTRRLTRWRSFDREAGSVYVEAGVTLGEILKIGIPAGWCLPVVPGTAHVSIGGAIASNIHGKNHHVDGGFANCVQSLDLLLADGRVRRVTRESDPDLFWATLGGMGLTGLVLAAELTLRRIETAYVHQRTLILRNLDMLLEALATHHDAHYSVAWLNLDARGRLRDSRLYLGKHAKLADLRGAAARAPLALPPRRRLNVPAAWPLNVLTHRSVSVFNRLYAASHRRGEALVPADAFFFPLDTLGGWNRLYGPAGFVQYQLLLPQAQAHEALPRVFAALGDYGRRPFLSVLKAMRSEPGMLAFAMDGVTLTLDLPVRPGLFAFLDRLDALLIRYGGRVYLSKDARLRADAFNAMYPGVTAWRAVRARVDPQERWQSALGVRLGLCRTAREPT